MKHKQPQDRLDSSHLITEQLAKRIGDEISTWTPDQKAHARARLKREFSSKTGDRTGVTTLRHKPTQANLSSLSGRAKHLHGLADAAVLIKSEEACFQEVMEFFEKLKTEDVKYIQ